MFTLFKTSKVSFKAPSLSKNYKKPLRASIKYKKALIYFLPRGKNQETVTIKTKQN